MYASSLAAGCAESQSLPKRSGRVRLAAVCARLISLSLAATAMADSTFDARDFNGIWLLAGGVLDAGDGFDTGASDHASGPAPLPEFDTAPDLKGEYLRNYQRLKERRAKAGIDIMVNCQPNGMPMLMAGPYANEVLQNAKQINWFQEFPGETRRIYLDGRPHPDPKAYPASYTGHSTGWWDGNTLVVDTVNIRTNTLLDSQGQMKDGQGHSEALRIIERLRLVDARTLRVDATVEDPQALVKPWHYTMTFHRHPAEEILEYVCEDNNRESVDPKSGREITEIPPRKTP